MISLTLVTVAWMLPEETGGSRWTGRNEGRKEGVRVKAARRKGR
jgi:hypothetical protein